MFKLIIVDDFFVERENAIEIIQESGLELEIVGEYVNGKDAYDDIENKRPDFILADIEMPIMNGLELGQLVKDNFPDIKMIFFSFYDKFEYVKKAMKLEAFSYILKPIIKEEMISSFEVIIKQRRQELLQLKNNYKLKKILIKSKPLLLDKFKRDMFIGLFKDANEIWERAEYLELEIVKGNYIILVLEIDDYISLIVDKKYEEKEINALRLAEIIEKELGKYEDSIFAKIDESHWTIRLSNTMSVSSESTPSKLTAKAYYLTETIIDALVLQKISVSFGISCVSNNIEEVNELYLQAINALKNKFSIGKACIIHYNDIKETTQNNDISLDEMQKNIKNALNSNSFSLGWEYIDKLFLSLEKNISKDTTKNVCFSFIICLQIALNDFGITLNEIFGKEKMLWEKLMKFETIKDVKMWLKNTLAFIVEYINNKQQNQSSNIISNVKKYVDKYYNESITVKEIAEELYYNPNYLNNIFKNETGETILDYITKKRIEVSKKMLLEQSGMKLYQICEAVGYKHVSYFRNVFKRYTGLNPKEFKDRANM